MQGVQIYIDTVSQNVRWCKREKKGDDDDDDDDAGDGFQAIGSSHIAFACQYHWGKAKGHNVGESECLINDY